MSEHTHPALTAKHKKAPDLQQSLTQYATAALGVAAITGMASAQTPSRHIIYTPANIPLDTQTSRFSLVLIDFNHDGVGDFGLVQNHFTDFFSGGLGFAAYGKLAASGYGAIASHAIPKGQIIDKAGVFKSGSQMMAYAGYGSYEGHKATSAQGAFTNIKNKYLGVRIQLTGQMHEGWIRLTLTTNKQVISGTVTGYAYDTVPNETGLAGGQIGGQVGTASTGRVFVGDALPGSLGALSAGSLAKNSTK